MWPEWFQLQPRGWCRWREANWRAVTNVGQFAPMISPQPLAGDCSQGGVRLVTATFNPLLSNEPLDHASAALSTVFLPGLLFCAMRC